MRRPGRRSAKKRMLIIVNPYATTVSNRLKNLVVYALQGRYEVETVATEAQNHATEIGREVRDHGYDIVVAFGGDGTLNEVANGLAGTDIPVSVLPGGSTNVVCRTLGIPNDVVDATEHLLALADEWAPRKIDLGMVDDRRFVFACGVGNRRHRRQARRRPSEDEVAGRALLLHLGRALGLLPRLSPQPGPRRGRGRGRRRSRGSPPSPRTPTRSPTSRAGRSGSARGSRSTTAPSRSGVLKRAAQRDMPTLIPRLFSEKRPRRSPPADRPLRRRHRGRGALDLDPQGRQRPPVPGPGRRRLHRRACRGLDWRSTRAPSPWLPDGQVFGVIR